MGDYVEVSDVLNVRQVAMAGVRTETVEMLIAGVENRVNSALRGQGYPTIPVDDDRDIAVIKQQVTQKVAALAYMSSRTTDELPGWCYTWNTDFEDWLKSVIEGTVLLMGQDPTHPGKQIRVNRLRVLPKVE